MLQRNSFPISITCITGQFFWSFEENNFLKYLSFLKSKNPYLKENSIPTFDDPIDFRFLDGDLNDTQKIRINKQYFR